MYKKILLDKDGNKFYIKDIKSDFHTKFGFIKSKDLNKKKIQTNKQKEFFVLPSNFIDNYEKLSRLAQIIMPKEIGAIISYTGVNKKSRVLDSGSGSGALSCFLANIVKEVITYDINDNCIKTTKKNIENLKLKNINIKKGNIYNPKEIDEKNIDLFTLDVPEPWQAIKTAEKCLKSGGFLISYSPNITQSLNLINETENSNLIYLKTIELIEREWVVGGKRARPKFQILGHTGFLSFFRKI